MNNNNDIEKIEKRLRKIQGTDEKHLWRIEHNAEWLWTTNRRSQTLLERISIGIWTLIGLIIGIFLVWLFK